MTATTFKPRKQQIHVPGAGVVQKQDFTQEHFKTLIKRAALTSTKGKTDKEKLDDFIKQYFVVDSYGDQPLFEESAAEESAIEGEKPKRARKAKTEAVTEGE